jgi:DNA-cytosine methyltransferase
LQIDEQPINFLDFCSGIGGGRIGLENLGMNCLGFSEIDKDAEITYREFFGDNEVNYGDLMEIEPNDLPDFDFMVGGFPCQTFSIIGTRCGLDDEARGQVIYGLVKILKAKNVKYLILENVKGIVSHDKGNTLKVVLELLDEAGYRVYHKVLNSLDFGVPQMRERIYFIGVKKELVDDDFRYEFPTKYSGKSENLEECFIESDETLIFDENLPAYQTFHKYLDNKYNKGKYNIDELLSQEYKVLDTRQSDLRIYYDKTPTLRRGRHGILYVRDGQFRKLSGYEALLLQKFPRKYADKVRGKISNTKLLQQAGNAMTSSVIEEIAKNLIEAIGEKMTEKEKLIKRGSTTAKDGFKNEAFVVEEFNNWKESELAQDWLKAMSYNLDEIERVEATKVKGSYKADVQVAINIEIKLKKLTDIQNLQVKLVSNPKGFNQIDKRWLKSYRELWDMPDDIYELLRYFTGEKKPKIENPRDERRMFANELLESEQQLLLNFFKDNKTLIISDILKGRGKLSAEWMLVILKLKNAENIQWALEPINKVLNHFGNGEILITPRGSFKIGNITVQRKGGDNGRETANMLQFKINPAELVDKK